MPSCDKRNRSSPRANARKPAKTAGDRYALPARRAAISSSSNTRHGVKSGLGFRTFCQQTRIGRNHVYKAACQNLFCSTFRRSITAEFCKRRIGENRSHHVLCANRFLRHRRTGRCEAQRAFTRKKFWWAIDAANGMHVDPKEHPAKPARDTGPMSTYPTSMPPLKRIVRFGRSVVSRAPSCPMW